MKIIIAVLASLAFAATAIAAVPSTPAEKKPIVKTVGQLELAAGVNKPGPTTSTSSSKGKNSKGSSYGRSFL
ncbi:MULTISPECIES: hypothetical protein [unclassified Ensifer]|uniref:hypothetical protein n=1 Tax=unclassified Ensifer TaxID=2633371 RepID=UPI0008135FBE|nr:MULTISPECIES: hypothetical protein [unclassified Ensifer]OCO99021.1 hypothetical protein BC362_27725 [Ensifer sp. LC14]OCP11358.1 hypothetical protein BC374_16945 [Ensifer sp. LC13]OCP11999.1 hypothetical protein BBX50_17375 [Ensifer sp. LC11]OCP33508.1 hypothetical protein BC364_16270 [Ensifer sp. LC499]